MSVKSHWFLWNSLDFIYGNISSKQATWICIAHVNRFLSIHHMTFKLAQLYTANLLWHQNSELMLSILRSNSVCVLEFTLKVNVQFRPVFTWHCSSMTSLGQPLCDQQMLPPATDMNKTSSSPQNRAVN